MKKQKNFPECLGSGVEVKTTQNIIDVDTLLLRNRTIFFNHEVNTNTSSILIKNLLYLEAKNPNKDIILYLNCPGGGIYSGLAIIDIMNKISCDIVTILIGLAASFGSMLLLNGTKGKRYATQNARVMIHQPLITLSSNTSFQHTDLDIQNQEMLILKKKLYQIMSEKTGKTINQIMKDCERDKYMSAEEALKYGIIDKII